MAQSYQEFITTVKLNSDDAKNKLEELRKKVDDLSKQRDALINGGSTDSKAIKDYTRQITKTEKEMASLEKQSHNLEDTLKDLGGASMTQLQQAQRQLNAEIAKTPQGTQYYKDLQAQLVAVKGAISNVRQEQKEVTHAIDKYDQALKAANKTQATINKENQLIDKTLKDLDKSSLRDVKASLQVVNERLEDTQRGTKEYEKLTEQAQRLKGELENINEEQEESESWWSKLGNGLNNYFGLIAEGWATLTGLTYKVQEYVQAFAGMEEAMADTRKYTGLSAEGVRELNEALKQMDTRTTREQLNELAGAAGRLGITSKESILEFVDAADKINVALGDDLGDGAIDQVGKLAMAFGEDERLGLRGAMLATGSAINELAQNSAANAGYLVDFTARVAGVGKQLGMTQSQIMGFGAVMDENLLQDEMSATAFSQLLTKMASDTKKFAKLAGMDAKDFAKLVKTDVNGALLTLFDNLKKTDGFENLAKMFGDMGLDGTRATSVLTSVCDKLDDVRRHQKTAADGYAEAQSVIDEFNTMNTTVEAELEKAQNALHEVSVELGEQLQPALLMSVSAGAAMIKMFSTLISWGTKHWKILVTLTSAVAAYTVAVNAALIKQKLFGAWSVIVSGYHKVETALMAAKAATVTLLGTSYNLLRGQITLATAAQTIWNEVIRANPYVAVAAAVATLTAALLSFARRTEAATISQKMLNDVMRKAKTETSGEIAELKALVAVARDTKQADETRTEAIRKLQEKYPEYLKNLSKENINSQDVSRSIDMITESLLQEAEARILVQKIKEAEAEEAELSEDYFDGISGLWNGIVAEFQATANTIADGIERVGNTIEGLGRGSLNGWDEETYITSEGYSRNVTQQWLNNYSAAVRDVESRIKTLKNRLKEVTQESLSVAPGSRGNDPSSDTGTGGGTYTSDADRKKEEAQRKKEEAARRKAEAQKKKEYKAEKDAEEAHWREMLNVDRIALGMGEMTLEEYRKAVYDQTMQHYDELIAIEKKYNGDDANEISSINSKKLQLLDDYNKESLKLQEEEWKHAEARAKMEVQRQYYTPGSDIFQDEQGMQQKITQIELTSLRERQELLKDQQREGSAEYIALVNEIEEKEEQARLDTEIYYQQKLQEYREQWLRQGNAQQEAIALRGLEQLHTKGLLTEEEYQKMLKRIKAQYAQNPTDKKNEDFDAGVQDAISLARSKADGGYDKTQGFSLSNNPYVGMVTQYKSTMEQIKELERQGTIDHQTAEQAKAEVTSEFLTDMVSKTQAAYDSVNQLMSAASSYYSAQSEYEQAIVTKKYDKQIEAAGDNTAKTKKLEEKKQKELAKIKSKYNKKQMKIEIAQAVASTAMAAINSYASASKEHWLLGAVAAAMATAAGMLQIATIKKQHAAEEAGYYEGGYTGGSSYKRTAGVVHEGEFVVNHEGVNNPSLSPILRMLDVAQRSNTIGSLTSADVSRQLGQGGAAVVAPVVNVSTDNSAIDDTLTAVGESVQKLSAQIDQGIVAHVSIDGPNGVAHQMEVYNRLKGNV